MCEYLFDVLIVLPAHQIWEWQGISSKRPGAKGKAKKTFFKSIQRGSETIKVCSVIIPQQVCLV